MGKGDGGGEEKEQKTAESPTGRRGAAAKAHC